MLSNPEFEYRGTVYPSLKVCCEELGINKSSVINRLYMLRKKTQPEANNDKILIGYPGDFFLPEQWLLR